MKRWYNDYEKAEKAKSVMTATIRGIFLYYFPNNRFLQYFIGTEVEAESLTGVKHKII
jgi:hypothetical protein